jgi:hypothetical protein
LHKISMKFRIHTPIVQSESMDNSQRFERLRLWISYPWINREERDFTYLVQQLKDAGVDAVYDSLQLLPDTHLWERAVQRLLGIGFDGWLYLLTHQCYTRKTCTDELTAAIDKTIHRMGPDFPMVGLLSGISTQHVPPIFRVRPCVSLSDPDWRQQICDTVRNHTRKDPRPVTKNETRFVWQIHTCYCENPSMTAIEVHSKDEESIPYWRFAIPKSARLERWGQGRAGGHDISQIRFAEATGSGRYRNEDVTWFGDANIISNTESAYAVFLGPLPEFICFGPANSPLGPPRHMEIYWTSLTGKTSG